MLTDRITDNGYEFPEWFRQSTDEHEADQRLADYAHRKTQAEREAQRERNRSKSRRKT